MLANIGLLALGCVLLYVGADRLISSALRLGRDLRLSPALTGLVIVAVGTSLPELAVSVDAAVRGYGAIAAGSVVGSNIVNLTLVLGAGAAIGTVAASSELRRWDMPFLAGLTVFSVMALADHELERFEGLLLLLGISSLLAHRLRSASRETHGTQVPELETRAAVTALRYRNAGVLLFAVVLLVLGAEAMVTSGVGLAQAFGVSEATIALTVTAIGTGIPEIAATLVAVARRHHELALGNIVGSNLMNLGLVLGVSALVAPLSFPELGTLPLLMMGIMTLTLWLLVVLFPAVYRWAGLMLLSVFGLYQLALVG